MFGITPAASEYVSAAITDMQSHGVTVTLSNEDAQGFGEGKLGGYFDEDGPTFFVATHPSPQVWMSVFVHEYQHYRQWQQKSLTWMARLSGDCCAWYVFDAWLHGVVELSASQRDDALRLILECERECEMMTLAEIELHPEMGLTPEWYLRAANVYLAFYGVARLTRQWYQVSPYADDSLVDIMPGDRLLAVEEALRPTPMVVGSILRRVYSDLT